MTRTNFVRESCGNMTRQEAVAAGIHRLGLRVRAYFALVVLPFYRPPLLGHIRPKSKTQTGLDSGGQITTKDEIDLSPCMIAAPPGVAPGVLRLG